ncbi:MAG: hypothetical protein JW791_01995 [Nanoarchaeota archaeon]|nr:hypothetical protein [Nanoarchaeota archaeon]
MILLVSTGCYHKVEDDTDTIIKKIIRKKDVNGFELNIASAETFMKYVPDKSIYYYISKSFCNTLHSPSKNIKYSVSDDDSKQVLYKLLEFYKAFKCRNITFHIDKLEEPEKVKDLLRTSLYFFENISVENPDKRFEGDSVEMVENFLLEHEDYNFTLDLCHALERRTNELSDFLDSKIIMERLCEVHWSFPGGSFKHDVYSEHFPEIKRLKSKTGFNTFLVIETDLRPELKERNIIKKEIRYARSF